MTSFVVLEAAAFWFGVHPTLSRYLVRQMRGRIGLAVLLAAEAWLATHLWRIHRETEK